jgi:hypothetical protein
MVGFVNDFPDGGPDSTLDNVAKFVSLVSVLFIVLHARVVRHKTVLSSNVQSVIDLPIHFTNFARRMEETLKDILQNGGRSQGYSKTFDGIHDGVDNVRTRVKKK